MELFPFYCFNILLHIGRMDVLIVSFSFLFLLKHWHNILGGSLEER
jgi:hypothetical protein